ncbi:MAG: riboflavin biosynthesis protein RibF [Planctomycetes bacterium]|nr:riboflavin biosynthesis protein RibF [Planctomycetota bacterium]
MKAIFWKDEAKGIPLAQRVVALGMFDGVHLGHQKTISTAVALAEESGYQSAIVTFDRHPQSVLSGHAPPLITSLRHRLYLFECLGADLCLVLHFDRFLAATTAREFLEKILIDRLGAKIIVLGQNATFGKGGEGNCAFLERVSVEYGIECRQVSLAQVGDRVVSSTAVREVITHGDLETAAAMLGRPFSLLGTVVQGDGMGAKLGFPTANLNLHHEARPSRGVYAGRAHVGEKTYDVVVNIGVRPTVKAGSEERVEVHLIGFQGDLRGQDLDVALFKRLRDEMHFETTGALAEQIRRDCEQAQGLSSPGKTT